MSQEFEKIVLEKLNKIEGTLDQHTDILSDHTKILKEHTGILNEHTEEIKSLREITTSNKASLVNLERKVNDISNTTRLYGNMLIEHEYDLNLKFDTLMDAFSLNKQKHVEYDDLFLHYNEKTIDHDIRLFKLENSIKQIKTA